MGIKDYFGNIKTLLVDIPNAELKAEIRGAVLNAQSEALDLQEKVGQLQEENAKLRAEHDARDEIAKIADQLFFARHAYWRKDETIDSAYCQTCWDTKHTLVRLLRAANGTGICNACKSRHPYAYDGPRPSEGDLATPDGPANPPITTAPPPSRRRMFRNI